MVRFISCIVLVLVSSAALAAAPPPPKGPVDLSRARCEDPKVSNRIKQVLPTFKVGGAFMSTYLGDNTNVAATTLEATRNELICGFTVNFFIRGATQSMHAKWIVKALPDGRVMETFDPGA